MSAIHLHETASVGLRASRLTGEGREHGRLVRLILLSYTRWPGQPKQDPWPCNATLASRAGVSENEAERAMSRLRSAGILTTRWGKRPKSKPGRLIHVNLHAPCKALAPDGFEVRTLWQVCRSRRARPAALVTMMVGAYMLASDAAGSEIEDWAPLGCSASELRRFIGHADNASWSKRLRELEALGLIRREGRRVEVSPPRAWMVLATDAAERSVSDSKADRVRTVREHRDRAALGEAQDEALVVELDLPGQPVGRVDVERLSGDGLVLSLDDRGVGVCLDDEWVVHEAHNSPWVEVFHPAGIDGPSEMFGGDHGEDTDDHDHRDPGELAAVQDGGRGRAGPDASEQFAHESGVHAGHRRGDGGATDPRQDRPARASDHEWLFSEDGRADAGMTREPAGSHDHGEDEKHAPLDLGDRPDLPAPPNLLRVDGRERERLDRAGHQVEVGRGRRTGTDGRQGPGGPRPEQDRRDHRAVLLVLRDDTS